MKKHSLYKAVIEAWAYILSTVVAVGSTAILGHQWVTEGWDTTSFVLWLLMLTIVGFLVTFATLFFGKLDPSRGCLLLPAIVAAALIEIATLVSLDR